MTTAQTTRREDFYRFHGIQVRSKDMDPAYPVLRDISRLCVSVEERVWLVIVFTAYYHMGSALRAFQETSNPRFAADAALDLPVATERRGHWHRPSLHRHLSAVQEIARTADGGLSGYFLNGLRGELPEDAWRQVQHRASKIPGNGRWASFKTAELVQSVVGLVSSAPDMQHAHSSGPRRGLGLLYANLPEGNDSGSVSRLDSLSRDLVRDMRSRGVPDVRTETVETSLCDFHSMVKGRYYPGHDIDRMRIQIDAVPSTYTSRAYEARLRTLPRAYLGETGGWDGVSRERMICYRTTGDIPERTLP